MCKIMINNKHKDFIIKELAMLEKLGWASDKKIAATIFPYVLVEAINLLMNSDLKKNPVDYTKNGKESEELINKLSKTPSEEMCFCQSYYDDENVLKDCSCRRCI